MTHESVQRIDALATDTASLLAAIGRSTPTPSWPDAPGRLARLAVAIEQWQRASWSGHLDAARGFDREFEELALGVRTAEIGYRTVDEDRGSARWTS